MFRSAKAGLKRPKLGFVIAGFAIWACDSVCCDGDCNGHRSVGVSQKSCDVLRDMGPKIQWQQSYVTDDKIYCVYIAESEKDVLEHAKKGGFPANRVSIVRAVIDPATSE